MQLASSDRQKNHIPAGGIRKLELLSPARDKNIGIAAIDCGADAVYIAGPSFGARQAAGNPVSDIAQLSSYAHKFSASVYATVNTLLTEEEKPEAEKLMWQLYDAGVDAFIIQDLSVLDMDIPPVELHASTQTVIRTPEQAAFLESLGFTRLILERQLSLEQIRVIRKAVKCDLEFFVHGALCVCYSGQCYLSQYLTGRSANRGCCAQPCRSKYDLVDSQGNTLVRNESLLSLKDYRLDSHIPQLAECGISSFKIEGRLKNISYVRNTVRHYRNVIDRFLDKNPQFTKSSEGFVTGGFTPDLEATFNRGFTDCFIDGNRGSWNSGESAKYLGQYLGRVSEVRGDIFRIREKPPMANGDGLSLAGRDGTTIGMRADSINCGWVKVKDGSHIREGMKVYRNFNISFEREIEGNPPKRIVPVTVDYVTKDGRTTVTARTEGGRTVELSFEEDGEPALKEESARAGIMRNLGKNTPPFAFNVMSITADRLYFHTISQLNSIRNTLAEKMPAEQRRHEARQRMKVKNNLTHLEVGNELMRSKYCIRHQVGLCLKTAAGRNVKGPLYLVNNGRRIKLSFDCGNCEMTLVKE